MRNIQKKEKDTFGKSGLMERSIIRPVSISLSEAPISRRKWFVGIRPAAAAFCLHQQRYESDFVDNEIILDLAYKSFT
jgi:hypothetical protein